MINKNIKFLATLVGILLLFSSCNIDHIWNKDHLFSYLDPQDGILIHDCSDRKLWHFFSFEKGEVIGSCDAKDSVETERWHNRTDWDLAFHRQDVKSNSGVSGIGLGGIMVYNQDEFDFDAVLEAPEDGYKVDVMDSIVYDISNMMSGTIDYVYTGLNGETKDWAVLTDMMGGVWTYAKKAFIVRTGEGKYAKIHLMNFKGSEGASGTVTMKYVYQADGTTNLNVTKEENSESDENESDSQ